MAKISKQENGLYHVQNQWGGNSAPWHDGGMWVIGARGAQKVITLQVHSNDGGRSLFGIMSYAGEGPIGFRATLTQTNTYVVENNWGDSPWQPGGTWLLGARNGQNVVSIDIRSEDNGGTYTGAITYSGEGPIGFKAGGVDGGVYVAENQWGGNQAPWYPGGLWVIGCRGTQYVVGVDYTSADGGRSINGTMTYMEEGPIGLKGAVALADTYITENQWGGSSAPWHPGGEWVLGCRGNQLVVGLKVSSPDSGKTLTGTTTYAGEGPIGFRASLR
ncbi:MAG: hypothetical protein KF778_13985 [Rhodocyclaceae bacterium]|nr:hypothetical protein [Rhodocyclaceae bacterium]MBX3669504.1 hypothetical protein [Rhodocyclaceae bacterium]